jgi:O-antigen ligase
MTITSTVRARTVDRGALRRAADWLAVAVAVSLPWSTSATGILIAIWLVVVLLTLDVAAVRRELATAAGGLPGLLCALAAVGMLWADTNWSARLAGFVPFLRLFIIPLLLAQFRRSDHGLRVLIGFLASAIGVLIFSWVLVLFPALPWHTLEVGVPVKDYILQSGEFLICAFALFALAFDAVRMGRWRLIAGIFALALLFLANIIFVATARTTLLVAAVFVLLLGWRQFRWKGLLSAAILFAILGVGVAIESPYLRARLNTSINELRAYERNGELSAYEANGVPNSTAQHLALLKQSVSIVRMALVLGHGTGSIPQQFRNSALGKSVGSSVVLSNPHNQILNVAIQLGFVGAVVLLTMWASHFLLFCDSTLTAWIGLLVVTDNVVSSLFSSHLFDFTQGWLYIFGVGVVGGIVQRERLAGQS